MVGILTGFWGPVATTNDEVRPSPAPQPVGGEFTNWLSALEPWSWLATIIGTVLGLSVVFAFLSRHYKSSRTAQRRRLQKQLSQLTLGTPSARVYEIVERQPTKAWNLGERDRPGGGRLEEFQFPDANLKVLVEEGIVQVLSVRAESRRFRMAMHGANEASSLVIGAATFGDLLRRTVSHHGLCNGSSKGTIWYYECRDVIGESDPNVWVYGWTPHGFHRAEDVSWWRNQLPQWLGEGPAFDNDFTPEQVASLEAFRQKMPINVVVAMRHYDPTPPYNLRMYL